jgi:hypothetical protein
MGFGRKMRCTVIASGASTRTFSGLLLAGYHMSPSPSYARVLPAAGSPKPRDSRGPVRLRRFRFQAVAAGRLAAGHRQPKEEQDMRHVLEGAVG